MVSSASCFVLENESYFELHYFLCYNAMLDTEKLRKIQFAELILTHAFCPRKPLHNSWWNGLIHIPKQKISIFHAVHHSAVLLHTHYTKTACTVTLRSVSLLPSIIFQSSSVNAFVFWDADGVWLVSVIIVFLCLHHSQRAVRHPRWVCAAFINMTRSLGFLHSLCLSSYFNSRTTK